VNPIIPRPVIPWTDEIRDILRVNASYPELSLEPRVAPIDADNRKSNISECSICMLRSRIARDADAGTRKRILETNRTRANHVDRSEMSSIQINFLLIDDFIDSTAAACWMARDYRKRRRLLYRWKSMFRTFVNKFWALQRSKRLTCVFNIQVKQFVFFRELDARKVHIKMHHFMHVPRVVCDCARYRSKQRQYSPNSCKGANKRPSSTKGEKRFERTTRCDPVSLTLRLSLDVLWEQM